MPQTALRETQLTLPQNYTEQAVPLQQDVTAIAWQDYFDDEHLTQLIDSALARNQELNIVFQELQISQNEVLEKSGEYLPFVRADAGVGVDKPGRFTRAGALEANLEIEEGTAFPEPLADFQFGAVASWEVDIWRKLRNARDAAQLRFLAANEGKNFLVSNLIAEIAATYYELTALDNLLVIITDNTAIQEDALRKVKLQKENAQANQLAVNRFEAQLLKTRNLRYQVRQQLVEAENKLRVLTGGVDTPLERATAGFMTTTVDSLSAGVPASLLENRPDIRQAELALRAASLDVQVVKADFYPSLDIAAGLGFQAFKPEVLLNPESLLLGLAGDVAAPLVNRKAIQARYNMASARQVQAVLEYEQTVLNAYTDVLNQVNKLDNYASSYQTKEKEVELLIQSVAIANNLFRYAKADYVEVLLTQEEVLDAKMELVETRLQQLLAKVDLYRALGGGWN